MTDKQIDILLADDDMDDCNLFRDALKELPVNTNLTTVHNGEKLMEVLQKGNITLPDVLFLDLNMPRKNGLECLAEIMLNERLKNLPVIIFSTSYNHDIVQQLHNNGAKHYIQKPNEFTGLKRVIQRVLSGAGRNTGSNEEKFVLEP